MQSYTINMLKAYLNSEWYSYPFNTVKQLECSISEFSSYDNIAANNFIKEGNNPLNICPSRRCPAVRARRFESWRPIVLCAVPCACDGEREGRRVDAGVAREPHERRRHTLLRPAQPREGQDHLQVQGGPSARGLGYVDISSVPH